MAPAIQSINPEIMASYIDHTLLKPEAQPQAFDTLCEQALAYGFKAVCVNSSRVRYVVQKLQGSDVAVCAVVGFPLGAMDTEAKAFEARRAADLGAEELDMVINIGALKAGDYGFVANDIEAVCKAGGDDTILKVIIETCLLSKEEKVRVCQISKAAGAQFVKTSTGFSTGGATTEDISLMRDTVGPKMGVKASGGIKDYTTALAMVQAGATRIGAGAGVEIVKGAPLTEPG
jgi:deoxyribose-phosphate aldolase